MPQRMKRLTGLPVSQGNTCNVGRRARQTYPEMTLRAGQVSLSLSYRYIQFTTAAAGRSRTTSAA